MPSAISAGPLCFLMDEEFVFRQELAKQLRRAGVDVVEFPNSSRIIDMVDEENPDIVFVGLNGAAPRECVKTLLALKECEYRGAVQLFGRCEKTLLASLNIVGVDFSLKMLPPIQKPIKAATVHKIILDQKYDVVPSSSTGALLSDALLNNFIRFLYQPKFDLKTNVMIGVEVVARVAHPEFGLLMPGQFLKGAAEDDLLKLSGLALVNALSASAHFHEIGISLIPAINIGMENLLQLPIADLVLKHRPQSRDWAGLLLEIPERQVVNKIEFLKARAPKLQQCGVSIAIDNFGRGPTYLGIFNEIPFSEIKMDRSLVESCATNESAGKICKSFVQLAHNFGIRATAVGISNEADLRTLREFGCDIGQGFLLGDPVTMREIDALIARFKREDE